MGYEAIYMKKISTIIGVKIKASDGNGNYCEKNNDKLGMEIKKGTTSRSKNKTKLWEKEQVKVKYGERLEVQVGLMVKVQVLVMEKWIKIYIKNKK